jgi:chemotaxis response regulator CheB
MTLASQPVEGADSWRGFRVVLASRDPRFLRVTSFLLGRKDFVVESTRSPERLLEAVARHRPDVVILDEADSLSLSARAIAGIEQLPYPVAVLVVAEAPAAESGTSVRLLHKWTSFDRLVQEVERLCSESNGNGEA